MDSLEKDVEVMKVPPYIGVRDVGRYFGLQRQKTWHLLARRDIKGSKAGKCWLISTASILRYLKRCGNIRGPNA